MSIDVPAMPEGVSIGSTCIVGFDSAWTDKPKAPGAICVITVEGAGRFGFKEPELASFRQALDTIEREARGSDRCLVALDQPTIVPNLTSLRPVDRVAASLISWLGGGVQPANRSKIGMFDDGAPLWPFLKKLQAVEDPEAARAAASGRFLIEVFPALAVASFESAFFGRLLGPRYNPARKQTFRRSDWDAMVVTATNYARTHGINGMADWLARLAQVAAPQKSDQDKLDAVLCALIGFHWLMNPRSASIMIGDLRTGYMIAPASDEVRARLVEAAKKARVAVDGALISN
ncbi:DUF429 domain-containing protein [Aureimonas sp. ME7]|uniref:DUF429 domain-containing protein n=1 Tax=Aureimonas sp. ME7 TaxID=2744252 RepID=UPI001FCEB566|nr:DUF429 domain-containing protein [Aureimonas sp. ME7]